MRIALCAFLLAAFGGVGHASETGPTFEWTVQNRFPLWASTPADGDLENLLTDLSEPTASASLEDRGETLFRKVIAFTIPNMDADYEALVARRKALLALPHWNAAKGRYDRAYLFPKSYKIRIRLKGAAGGDGCNWSVDGVNKQSAPCDHNVELDILAVTSPAFGGAADIGVLITGVDGSTTAAAHRVEIRNRLIVSLGDSFASGEGNPDIPTYWGSRKEYYGVFGKDDWGDGRWLGRRLAVRGIISPVWWDQRCHRSFYSQHLIAALKYAAEARHDVTTFISYACSGASTFNGLLTPQPTPPGYRDDPRTSKLDVAQIDALERDLCPPSAAGKDQTRPTAIEYTTQDLRPNGRLRERTFTAPGFSCPVGRRPVDALLLTVGGNDAGFSSVIMDAMITRAPTRKSFVGDKSLGYIRTRMTRLPEAAQAKINRTLRLDIKQFQARLRQAIGTAPVIQSTYPNPTGSGRKLSPYCGPLVPGTEHDDSLRLTALNGVWPDLAVPRKNRWPMEIDQDEGRFVTQTMLEGLNGFVLDLRDDTKDAVWLPVTGFKDAFAGRGWCAAQIDDEQKSIPNFVRPGTDGSKGNWVPYEPREWSPYAPHDRLFRTPNDAALTQITDHPRSRLGSASRFVGIDIFGREALLAAMSGAFHPTFEAHAIMGVGVNEALKKALPPSP